MKRGYTKVYRFAGGIPEWRGFNYPMLVDEKFTKIRVNKLSPDKVAELLKEEDIFILDVRPHFLKEPEIIKNSVRIPLTDIIERLSEIPRARDILITDWTMKQSLSAAKYLAGKGYRILGVLKGGVLRWKTEERSFLISHP